MDFYPFEKDKISQLCHPEGEAGEDVVGRGRLVKGGALRPVDLRKFFHHLPEIHG